MTYGSTIALQHVDGRFLVMGPDGRLRLQAATEARWDARLVLPFRDRKDSAPVKFLFPVVDLMDLHNKRSVAFGDPVWLVVRGQGTVCSRSFHRTWWFRFAAPIC